MKHEQVEFLQDKLVQEAAAMIALAGSETKVEEYEQAIKLARISRKSTSGST